MAPVVRAVLVLAVVSGTALADRPKPGWGPGLAVGVTRSSMDGTDADYGARTSMAVAFRASWQSRGGMSVSTGLQVAQYGFSNGPHGLVREYMEDGSHVMCPRSEDCPDDVETALNVMSIQATIRYQLRSVPLYLAVGLELGFLMGARSRSSSEGEVIDSTRHFAYRAPLLAQRLGVGLRFVRPLSIELTWHQPLNTWGNGDTGLGPMFADSNVAILSLVLGK